MKVNVNVQIKDLDGNDIEGITVKGIIVQALTVLGEEDKNMTGDMRYTQYDLARRITEAGDVAELKAEDIVLIKKLVGKMYQPIVVGRIYDALEG